MLRQEPNYSEFFLYIVFKALLSGISVGGSLQPYITDILGSSEGNCLHLCLGTMLNRGQQSLMN